ncbi:hypothetical protein SAMN04487904_10287 [Actinopolyspora lacussalsi subsp. righensis]|uniref:Uncharacterized protein n=1 Tax=Actinopolyspora righensis TaxID=995060 RepID=A0A1I6Y0B9_9ACTN|nr:hypothetical protein [Actinopolyspora righensis]SFT43866.1 hypothetical protein SAMN04487904_10287 [Actinopolyspora righensis]
MSENPQSETEVLRDIARELRKSNRDELREIGEAVETGSHTFGELARNPGYADFFQEVVDKMNSLTEQEFLDNETSLLEPPEQKPEEKVVDRSDEEDEEDGPPETFLV